LLCKPIAFRAYAAENAGIDTVQSLDEIWTKPTFECRHESLLTPLGLRTLAPVDPEYAGRYRGSPLRRDGAYH
jgi:glycogen debranching enzyme